MVETRQVFKVTDPQKPWLMTCLCLFSPLSKDGLARTGLRVQSLLVHVISFTLRSWHPDKHVHLQATRLL